MNERLASVSSLSGPESRRGEMFILLLRPYNATDLPSMQQSEGPRAPSRPDHTYTGSWTRPAERSHERADRHRARSVRLYLSVCDVEYCTLNEARRGCRIFLQYASLTPRFHETGMTNPRALRVHPMAVPNPPDPRPDEIHTPNIPNAKPVSAASRPQQRTRAWSAPANTDHSLTWRDTDRLSWG